MEVKDSVAYQYAKWCLEPDNDKVGEYVKLQAKAWVQIVSDLDTEAVTDDKTYTIMMGILDLMVHPDLHCPMSQGLEPYAMLLITAVMCTKCRDEPQIRYYESALLEIARKNFKTFNCAVIFILLLIMEPMLSRFFSVAPDLKLSSELKFAINKIIKHSPALTKHFKILRSMGVICKLNDSEYTPLAYSEDGMDGKMANAFLADEAGALDSYPVEAMRSSQITLRNKLGIVISTQYPNEMNVMIDEIDKVKKILRGEWNNKRYFGLLYEPDESIRGNEAWKTDDRIIYQANPAAVSMKYIFDNLAEKREDAIQYQNKRENFLCKHCNIQYKSLGEEAYVDMDKVRACSKKIPHSFWRGKRVFLALDLSKTDDNTALAMCCIEDDIIYAKVWGFVPEERIKDKSEREKFDYRASIDRGECFSTPGNVIKQRKIEKFIKGLKKEYGLSEIALFGYDPWNADKLIQDLESCEDQTFITVDITQHSRVLHKPTKYLKEHILEGTLCYDKNSLLTNNFENARCKYDQNLNLYVSKLRSKGKVDMVVALINAVYLAQQDELNNRNSFIPFAL